jgi:histidine ammonia-lyase
MVDLAPVVLGCELVAAVRAIRMTGEPLPEGPLRGLFDLAATAVAEDRADRPLSGDLAAAVLLVERGL